MPKREALWKLLENQFKHSQALQSLRTGSSSSWIFRKCNSSYLNFTLKKFPSPHKKFPPRTQKSGILLIFGRENTLTFGTFSDHPETIWTKQRLTCESVWPAPLLRDSISSCHVYSERKYQISDHLKNVNQVQAELLPLAQCKTLLNSFPTSSAQVPGPQMRNKYSQEGYYICFLYRFR